MTIYDVIDFAGNAIGVVLLIGGFIAALIQLVRVTVDQWRDPAKGSGYVLRSYAMIALYILASALAVVVMLGITGGEPCPDSVALPATMFVLLWIGFGVLWLIRLAPRDTPLPGWISPSFGLIDAVLLVLVAACLYLAWKESDKCGPAAQQTQSQLASPPTSC